MQFVEFAKLSHAKSEGSYTKEHTVVREGGREGGREGESAGGREGGRVREGGREGM